MLITTFINFLNRYLKHLLLTVNTVRVLLLRVKTSLRVLLLRMNGSIAQQQCLDQKYFSTQVGNAMQNAAQTKQC